LKSAALSNESINGEHLAPAAWDHADFDRIHSDVRVKHESGGGLVVTSSLSKDYTLEPNVEFKLSQFLRTVVYEALPPSLDYVVCVLTEMVVFGHTRHESICCASSRMLLPFPVFGPLKKVFVTNEGNMPFNMQYCHALVFWFPILAVYFSEDVRHYIEPLEVVPMVILQVCRVFVLACKYALLPTSYVGGKMYKPMTSCDIRRTLVASGWNEPKNEAHSDLLRMELENACLEADVDLLDTEINLGSTRAAMVVRMRARGVGERATKQVSASPAVVSGKELLAALMDTFIGKAAPSWLSSGITLIAILFALVSPARLTKKHKLNYAIISLPSFADPASFKSSSKALW
jgi:hypothetical protein